MSGTDNPKQASLRPRRDHAVNSSGGLLLTVMGELILPNGGSAWTQSVVELLGLLNVREKAARQALVRMSDRGLLHRQRVGRQTRWSLTDTASSLLVPGAERIYAFGQHRRPWDRKWVVLLASVPETERIFRYRMTVGLSWAGFGSIGQGTWLSPWAQQEHVAVELLRELGVDATSFVAQLGELGSASELAKSAWDLPRLRADYESFLADTATASRVHPTGHVAAELISIVHRWRRFPSLDPDLPSELLPADWPGTEAASRFAQLRAALVPEAMRWWRQLEAGFEPTRAAGSASPGTRGA